MKKILGMALILTGIALGVYFGLWVMFIGGIVQIINALSPLEAMSIAFGVVKIIFASLIGWICAIFPLGIGLSLLD